MRGIRNDLTGDVGRSVARGVVVLGAGLLLLQVATPASAESGWLADGRTGCKVWDLDIETGESVTWSGACVGGLAEGPGVVVWTKGGKLEERDEGTYRAGKMEGMGYVSWPDGSRDEGEYRAGRLNGRGVRTFAEDGRCVGQFRDDDREGHVECTSTNGKRYEGEWKGDKRNGRGIQVYDDGGRYEGEWRDDNRDGRGSYVWKDGTRYDGEWRNGKQEGRGVLVYGVEKYDGEWKDDQRHGRGVQLYKETNGSIVTYSGEWSHGCFWTANGVAINRSGFPVCWP